MLYEKKVQFNLLFLRLSIFLVMFIWTVDKFTNPEHAIKVYEKFYFITGIGEVLMYAIATVEMLILLMFLVGYKKLYSYGAVCAFHSISTLTPLMLYFDPFNGANLLFFAAWPMLAACYTLFLFREQDSLCSLN